MWLWATAVDGEPGGVFAARHLPASAPRPYEGDVVVRLGPGPGPAAKPAERARAGISQRTGLGAPADTAALCNQIDGMHQQILDLRRTLEVRDEELAAAREANRKMMAELTKATS